KIQNDLSAHCRDYEHCSNLFICETDRIGGSGCGNTGLICLCELSVPSPHSKRANNLHHAYPVIKSLSTDHTSQTTMRPSGIVDMGLASALCRQKDVISCSDCRLGLKETC